MDPACELCLAEKKKLFLKGKVCWSNNQLLAMYGYHACPVELKEWRQERAVVARRAEALRLLSRSGQRRRQQARVPRRGNQAEDVEGI